MVIIPRNYLYSAKWEEPCLKKVLNTLHQEFEGKLTRQIIFSTKRNLHFFARVEKILKEHVSSSIILKLCFANYQDKILEIINSTMPKEREDLNLINIKEKELMFNYLKSIVFLPD